MKTKICSHCGEEKNITEFGLLNVSPDKLNPKCKECNRRNKRKYIKVKPVSDKECIEEVSRDYTNALNYIKERGRELSEVEARAI